jgi:Flp pilus assembly protein TadG
METVRKTNVRRGFSLVMISLTLVVLMGFIGLACDVGYGLLVAHQLQNAADAAALAGAGRLKSGQDDARLAAIDVAALNSAATASLILDYNATNVADGDIVIGRFDRENRIFTPGTEAPNSVKVVARRTAASANGPLTLLFGRMFGTETVDVSRHAIAMNQGSTGGGLIALCDDCECALQVSGSR